MDQGQGSRIRDGGRVNTRQAQRGLVRSALSLNPALGLSLTTGCFSRPRQPPVDRGPGEDRLI